MADFLTDATGQEVLFLQIQSLGLNISGYSFGPDGLVLHSAVGKGGTGYIRADTAADVFAQLMSTPPTLMPAPTNIIPLAEGMMLLPDYEP